MEEERRKEGGRERLIPCRAMPSVAFDRSLPIPSRDKLPARFHDPRKFATSREAGRVFCEGRRSRPRERGREGGVQGSIAGEVWRKHILFLTREHVIGAIFLLLLQLRGCRRQS